MPELTLVHYAVLFAAGIVSGVINTVAGGGSALTLPALIFAGLPGTVANATNRIGVILQNVTAISRFRKGGVREDHLTWRLVVAAVIGSIGGALLAAHIPDEKFERLLGVLLLCLLVPILKKRKTAPSKGAASNDAWSVLSPKRKVGAIVSFFFLGAYAGFLQAGVGVMILATLGWVARLDLVKGNYIKLNVVLGTVVVSLCTFLVSGVAVLWIAGLVVGIGQMIGAVAGSWVAIRKGEVWIRWILIVSIVGSSAKLLGVLELVRGL